MKPSIINRFLIPLLTVACITSPAIAGIITKTGSGIDLTDGASWTGGSGIPISTDVATWDSTSLGAGLTAVTDVNWGSIDISGAAEAIGITGAGKITTGDITLAGNRTLTIANKIALSTASIYTIADVTGTTATDATLSAEISGDFGLTKSGAGTLRLSGVNIHTGGTDINGGTLVIGATNTLSTTGTINVGTNGIFEMTGVTSAALRDYGTRTISGSGVINLTGSGLPVFDHAKLSGFTGTINMNLSDSNTIYKKLAFQTTSTGTMPSASSTINVSNGTTLYLNIRTYTGTVNVLGSGVETFGALRLDNATLSGSVHLLGDTSIGSNTATGGTISGNIDGAFALNKISNNRIILSGANAYTGKTTITASVLEATTLANGGSASAIGASTNAAANLVFGAPTANLRYTGSTSAVTDRGFTLSSGTGGGATIESSGTGTLAIDNAVSIAYGTADQTRLLTLGGTNTGANTFGKVLANNGTAATSLTKAGAGTWALSGTNTYTGNTTVSGGNLTLADNAQLVFVIGANGVNNKITGTGTVTLAGDFNLNLAGANTTTGNEWTLVDVGTLTETFASTFSLVGFTETSNVHTKVAAGVTWTFTEASGKLTVVNDYGTWLAGFTFGLGADTTPTGDPDGDGLINRQEHAFGLNPASGSSASPVTVMLDKTAGTFSYTRRKPSLTGMTFKIETSTTLTGWSEDATATQSVTGTVGDIETVQVTLSGPIPLTASKFFVRAVATQP